MRAGTYMGVRVHVRVFAFVFACASACVCACACACAVLPSIDLLYNLDCCFIAFSGVRSPFCNDDAVQSSGGRGGLRLTRSKQCGCCI